jgi:hypothetical protein
MDGNVKWLTWTSEHWQELLIDLSVPLAFAVLTAGFFVLAAR